MSTNIILQNLYCPQNYRFMLKSNDTVEK